MRGKMYFLACLVNNETYESYRWALEKFFQQNKPIPDLILSDQDPAVMKAIGEYGTTPLLCQ